MDAMHPVRTPGRLLAVALATLLAMALLLPAQVRAETEPKVVYHADFSDPRRFSAMLTSINNMVTHYQNELIDYDVRIVLVAHGIRFVTDDKLVGTPFEEDAEMAERRENNASRLMALHTVQGVSIEVCDITRTQIGLDREKLYGGVELVTSGVVRIAELQQQHGFAYIKVE